MAGLGDATIGGRAWLFKAPTESGANVGIGVSLVAIGEQHRQAGIYVHRRVSMRLTDTSNRWYVFWIWFPSTSRRFCSTVPTKWRDEG